MRARSSARAADNSHSLLAVLGAVAVALGLAVALPAPVGATIRHRGPSLARPAGFRVVRGPSSVRRRFAPMRHVWVTFRYRPASANRRPSQTLVTLARNRIVLRRGNPRHLTVQVGGQLFHLPALRGRRARSVRLTVDVPRDRVLVVVSGGDRASVNAPLAPETGVTIGSGRALPPAVSHVVVAVSGRAPAAAPAQPAPETARPFSPDGIWNAPLSDSAPIAGDSANLVGDLVRQVTSYSPWLNINSFSTPVYTVPAGQPTVHVTLDTSSPALQAAFDRVPVPPGAQAAAGSDEHMVVWQPSRDTMWEFWLMHQTADGWHARWGGRMTHVSHNPGVFNGAHPEWGATATSLPLLGGLIRISEVQAGHIDHALALSVPEPRREVFASPAERTDGSSYSTDAIPEGTRFRLDPSLDIASLGLPPLVRMLAEAAQRYGIIVRDKAGSVSFYAEDPGPFATSDPYAPLLGGQDVVSQLRAFPWSQLEVVDAPQHCCWHS